MFAMGVSCSIDTHRMKKVRLYSILMEDVRELKEFVVKHCRVVCFSGGGQYFSFSHNAQVGNTWLLFNEVQHVAKVPSVYSSIKRSSTGWGTSLFDAGQFYEMASR